MNDQLLKLMNLAFAAGYQRGHNDTVEDQFVDIHPADRHDYFMEEVADILEAETPKEVKIKAMHFPA